ncbi:type I-E CRISPR-associated protein Cse2/CasB [Streptomyces goshikiensis]|uniref:type I-E CRISPR-associated protein Cse2/CasB n=1 Tax=Streptomyces goshikiensis TaxID=1942 RepID=UPI0036893811
MSCPGLQARWVGGCALPTPQGRVPTLATICSTSESVDRISYDLCRESCITALTIGPDQAKQLAELTIPEVYEQAEDILGLAHISPGVRMALYRLLLGLLYITGVYPRTEREARQWVLQRHPLSEAADVLRSKFKDKLDLFHPVRPFGQNILLAPFMADHGYGPAQLDIERAGNGAQLEDHVHLHHPWRPTPAEALAAMLTKHLYDPGGRMMAQNSWLGRSFTYGALGQGATRVLNLAMGDSLADTLRLNLAPAKRAGTFNFTWTEGCPDRRTFTGDGANLPRRPDGPADLHSWLGRSILLQPAALPDGTVVVDRVLVGAGDLMEELPHALLQDAVLVGGRPQQARAETALWRSASALYAGAGSQDPGNAKDEDLFARLTKLKRKVDIWSVGLITSQRTLVSWVSDTYPFVGTQVRPLHLAAVDGAAWCAAAEKAVWSGAAAARGIAFPNARPEERKVILERLHPGPVLWARFEGVFHELLDAIAASDEHAAEQQPLVHAQARADFARSVVAVSQAALEAGLRSLPASGLALEALVKAEARLTKALSNPRAFPAEFLEATMPPTPDVDAPPSAGSAPSSDSPLRAAGTETESTAKTKAAPSGAFAHWLVSLVETRNHGFLKPLKESLPSAALRGEALEALSLAADFAPREGQRSAYELTAHLFARYHAAMPTLDRARLYGSGDMGAACRRIGLGFARGPADPGSLALFRRLTGDRSVPAMVLSEAVDRLRAGGSVPPHWASLVEDLADWPRRQESVRKEWARSFYTPASRARQNPKAEPPAQQRRSPSTTAKTSW